MRRTQLSVVVTVLTALLALASQAPAPAEDTASEASAPAPEPVLNDDTAPPQLKALWDLYRSFTPEQRQRMYPQPGTFLTDPAWETYGVRYPQMPPEQQQLLAPVVGVAMMGPYAPGTLDPVRVFHLEETNGLWIISAQVSPNVFVDTCFPKPGTSLVSNGPPLSAEELQEAMDAYQAEQSGQTQ